MIQNLVTIIIPSSDSLFGLKSTIESLVFQTKIKGTRVLVADLGSSDGSIQYAAQLTYDLRSRLKVEPFDFDKDRLSVYSNVNTPYVFFISPGKIIQDRDFIMDHLNKISNMKEVMAYSEETMFRRIIKGLGYKKEAQENVGLLVRKENIYDIFFTLKNDKIFIDLPNKKTKTSKI